MSLLSSEGQAVVNDVAMRHGFSADAVTHLLVALDQGGGSQAQFNHPEMGGMGQWSMGGMIMIGDMFNNGLKARVDSVCSELSNTLANRTVFQPPVHQTQSTSYQGQSQNGGQMQMQGGGNHGQSSLFVAGSGLGNWWPDELGQPGSTGAQNDLKYAYFPANARLAILLNGQVTVYDTGVHQIGGFGQQQSGDQSLTFTSQFGLVRVADLPVLTLDGTQQADTGLADTGLTGDLEAQFAPAAPAAQPGAPESTPSGHQPPGDSAAIFEMLEKLGDLRDKGVLSEEEFSDKKMDLLARL